MNPQEWLARCSARLHAQWPKVPQTLRDEVAAELRADPRWTSLPPEDAAAAWLAQGLPNDTREAR
jgi:hypothetical protein